MADSYTKKVLGTTNHQENADRDCSEVSFHTCEDGHYQNDRR